MKWTSLLGVLIVFFSCNSAEHPGNTTNNNTVSKNISSSVYGIDISKYQGDEIDFLNKHTDSLVFVICKATEGIDMLDPDFRNNWQMIRQKGFIRGAYHFFHCGDDSLLQAQNFLSALDSLTESDLCPIIDVEEAGTGSCLNIIIQKNLLGLLRQVEKRSGRIPMIYTDNNTATHYITNPAFSRYPLYIADYSRSSLPSVPGIWESQNWTIWQKTDSLKLEGDYNDFDLYNGDINGLKNFIRTH